MKEGSPWPAGPGSGRIAQPMVISGTDFYSRGSKHWQVSLLQAAMRLQSFTEPPLAAASLLTSLFRPWTCLQCSKQRAEAQGLTTSPGSRISSAESV
jgi:hypothetical protein